MAWLAGTGLFRLLYRHANMSFVIARSAWGDRRTMSAATWAPYLPAFPDPDSRERVLFALAKSMAGESAFFDSLWRRLGRFASAHVHLVWGMRDSAFPPSALARFQQVWPQATTLRLDAAGHWPHEEQPAACVASVRQVLAER
jgi:haloalkane dehalogenase